MPKTRTILVVASMLLAVPACATKQAATPSPTVAAAPVPSSTIGATLAEYSILPSPDLGKAGEISFNVHNSGKVKHEFVIIKSDLDPGKLPTKPDGEVDESKVASPGEIGDIPAGATKHLKLTLPAGNYSFICNIDDLGKLHYKLGMRAGFTVQ